MALEKNSTPADWLGLAVGLLPFSLSWSTTTSTSTSTTAQGIDVPTTVKSHMDDIAVGSGVLAIVFAFAGLARIGKMRTRALRFAVFAGLLALGGFQLVRGFMVEEGSSVSGFTVR